MSGSTPPPFVPPPYPYDRLDELKALCSSFGEASASDSADAMIDLSIGTPCDAPPAVVTTALARAEAVHSYPPSIGTPAFRESASNWLERRLGVTAGPEVIGACLGTKEFVAGVPHWLRLRDPGRDTVLYPEMSYPSYAMGATLAGCRAVPVPVDDAWCLRLDAIEVADAERALCLWVNTPGNPAGGLDDLGAAARWGRDHGVMVLSDECYVEFTWSGPPRTILEHGLDGVLALHSLSKRSNLAGLRVGFYAGDPELVHYLREIRKHGGYMVPGPTQAAAVAAFDDDAHVDAQRAVYLERLELGRGALAAAGVDVELPGGAFYLWAPAPGGDAWAFAKTLATEAGTLVSPGEFYGAAGAGYVRLAMVQPTERIQLMADRLGGEAAFQ